MLLRARPRVAVQINQFVVAGGVEEDHQNMIKQGTGNREFVFDTFFYYKMLTFANSNQTIIR